MLSWPCSQIRLKETPAKFGSHMKRRSGAGHGRSGDWRSQCDPVPPLSRLSFQEVVASLIPGEDIADFVVEDEVTAICAHHQHGMASSKLIQDNRHSQRPVGKADRDEELALEQLKVLTITSSICGVVPTILGAPMIQIRQGSDIAIDPSIDRNCASPNFRGQVNDCGLRGVNQAFSGSLDRKSVV